MTCINYYHSAKHNNHSTVPALCDAVPKRTNYLNSPCPAFSAHPWKW